MIPYEECEEFERSEGPMSERARDVAVVVTGLLRSLCSPPVAKTYEQHVVAPLRNRLDTFIVVVDNTTTHALLREQVAVTYPAASLILMSERVHSHLSCAIRGTRVDWASANPRDINASQKLRVIDRDQGRMVAHSSRVLLQWYAIRAGYLAVEAAEKRRGSQYSWLLRTRTDIVHLESFADRWLATASRAHVYVAEGGMNGMTVAMCQNDHFFLCPRHLCRPYFHLMELWESRNCRAAEDSSAATKSAAAAIASAATATDPASVDPTSLASIFATRSPSAPGGFLLGEAQISAPNVPFLLPPPPRYADAEWYFLARYGSGEVCDADVTTDAACCGLIREVPYLYSLARGDSRQGRIECNHRLIYYWRGTNASALRERHAGALERCLQLDHSYRICGRKC